MPGKLDPTQMRTLAFVLIIAGLVIALLGAQIGLPAVLGWVLLVLGLILLLVPINS